MAKNKTRARAPRFQFKSLWTLSALRADLRPGHHGRQSGPSAGEPIKPQTSTCDGDFRLGNAENIGGIRLVRPWFPQIASPSRAPPEHPATQNMREESMNAKKYAAKAIGAFWLTFA